MPTSHPTIKNNDDGQKKESHVAHEIQTPKSLIQTIPNSRKRKKP